MVGYYREDMEKYRRLFKWKVINIAIKELSV